MLSFRIIFKSFITFFNTSKASFRITEINKTKKKELTKQNKKDISIQYLVKLLRYYYSP